MDAQTKLRLFNQIYSEQYKSVYAFVLSRVNGRIEDAEDITMEVFGKVNRYLEEYDEEKGQMNTWIFNIAKNHIIDFYRKDNSSMTINVDGFVNDNGDPTFEFIDDVPSVETVETEDTISAVKRAMSKLNEKERQIATMFFIQQRKYTEIANVLDVPMGTVKGLLNRVRAKLQCSLSKTYASL